MLPKVIFQDKILCETFMVLMHKLCKQFRTLRDLLLRLQAVLLLSSLQHQSILVLFFLVSQATTSMLHKHEIWTDYELFQCAWPMSMSWTRNQINNPNMAGVKSRKRSCARECVDYYYYYISCPCFKTLKEQSSEVFYLLTADSPLSIDGHIHSAKGVAVWYCTISLCAAHSKTKYICLVAMNVISVSQDSLTPSLHPTVWHLSQRHCETLKFLQISCESASPSCSHFALWEVVKR